MARMEVDLLSVDRGSVTAPAGCGKTHRIAEALVCHVNQRPILVLTHTNAGVALNQHVLAKLTEIDKETNQVAGMMQEIAAAGEQQASGISQVNSSVEQLNATTQQAAANAEESAAAAEELGAQSASLLDMVDAFTLEDSGRGGKSARKPTGSSGARKPSRPASHAVSQNRPKQSVANGRSYGNGNGKSYSNGASQSGGGRIGGASVEQLMPFDDDPTFDSF